MTCPDQTLENSEGLDQRVLVPADPCHVVTYVRRWKSPRPSELPPVALCLHTIGLLLCRCAPPPAVQAAPGLHGRVFQAAGTGFYA